MSVRRVMGTEVEYGISVPGQPGANPMVTSSQIVNAYGARPELNRGGRARWDYEEESPLRDARGFTYSGAMIENIVARAKKTAVKDFLEVGQKGIRLSHLLSACVDEFQENEDLPNTTNPDDWAKISGKKGERIVYVRTLVKKEDDDAPTGGRAIERVATGQYL